MRPTALPSIVMRITRDRLRIELSHFRCNGTRMDHEHLSVDHITPPFDVKSVCVVSGAQRSDIGEPYRNHRIVVISGQIDVEITGPEDRSMSLSQGDAPLDLTGFRICSISAANDATSIVISGVESSAGPTSQNR